MGVCFPEIQKSVVPIDTEQERVRVRTGLQDLAEEAGIGVMVNDRDRGKFRFTLAGEGQLQCTINGEWQPPFHKIEFGQGGLITFPELDTEMRIPPENAEEKVKELHRLASMGGNCVSFRDANSKSTVYFSIGHQQLHFFDGINRTDNFKFMTLQKNGEVDLPELGRKVMLPKSKRTVLWKQLQRMATFAGLGMELPHFPSGDDVVLFNVAGDGRLQYSLNGQFREPFLFMNCLRQTEIYFPELDSTLQLESHSAGFTTATLQNLFVMTGSGVAFEVEESSKKLVFHVAGPDTLQLSIDGKMQPPFKRMGFSAGALELEDINMSFQLPQNNLESVTVALQHLGCLAKIGAEFEDVDGRMIRITPAGSGYLQMSRNGVVTAPFRAIMTFWEDGLLELHEADEPNKVRLPVDRLNELMTSLQHVAAFTEAGVQFDCENEGPLRFHAAHGELQLSCNEEWRPPFKCIFIGEEGTIRIPELGMSIIVPKPKQNFVKARLMKIVELADAKVSEESQHLHVMKLNPPEEEKAGSPKRRR